MLDFSPSRNGFGKFVMTLIDGTVHEGVVPVRVSPISVADEGLNLMSMDSRELAWITQLGALPTPMRVLTEAGFDAREFMLEIRTIVGVSTYAASST